MIKNFILDTNVLLHDPNAITHFTKHNVLVPLKAIEEIDMFKREMTERGRNARTVARSLDHYRSLGLLSKGVQLPKGGLLRVVTTDDHDPFHFNPMQADAQILKTATEIRDRNPGVPCTLITKDINLRLKADAVGMAAEDYENGHVDVNELYTGQQVIDISAEALDHFESEHSLKLEDESFTPNIYLTMHEENNPNRFALGRYDKDRDAVVPLIYAPPQMGPIHPRNAEQRFAMDALLNDKIGLVTLAGKAGTGKTLLAVAAAVYQTVDQQRYDKMLVSRPTFPMGKDIGYLPGDIDEKLNPWMQPIEDALNLINHGRGGNGKGSQHQDYIHNSHKISVEPLTYIRGRSIPNQFMIIDESQNLTPLEVKTVITRVGNGTKIVFTGDIYQIDNPYVDTLSNGLNAIAERFRDYSIASHIMLKEGVRSELAELASNIL